MTGDDLRELRRGAGLTAVDVAFLVGAGSSGGNGSTMRRKIARLEGLRGKVLPSYALINLRRAVAQDETLRLRLSGTSQGRHILRRLAANLPI